MNYHSIPNYLNSSEYLGTYFSDLAYFGLTYRTVDTVKASDGVVAVQAAHLESQGASKTHEGLPNKAYTLLGLDGENATIVQRHDGHFVFYSVNARDLAAALDLRDSGYPEKFFADFATMVRKFA